MASKAYPNIKFILFGDKNKSKDEIQKISNLKDYEFVHTTESISSSEQPVNALRKLKKSSMRLGINSVKLNECDGLVSAGNTGALMAISKFVLKTICFKCSVLLTTFMLHAFGIQEPKWQPKDDSGIEPMIHWYPIAFEKHKKPQAQNKKHKMIAFGNQKW